MGNIEVNCDLEMWKLRKPSVRLAFSCTCSTHSCNENHVTLPSDNHGGRLTNCMSFRCKGVRCCDNSPAQPGKNSFCLLSNSFRCCWTNLFFIQVVTLFCNGLASIIVCRVASVNIFSTTEPIFTKFSMYHLHVKDTTNCKLHDPLPPRGDNIGVNSV